MQRYTSGANTYERISCDGEGWVMVKLVSGQAVMPTSGAIRLHASQVQAHKIAIRRDYTQCQEVASRVADAYYNGRISKNEAMARLARIDAVTA